MNEFQRDLQNLEIGDFHANEVAPWDPNAYEMDQARQGFGRCFRCFRCFNCFRCSNCFRCANCFRCFNCGGCGGCGGRCGGRCGGS